jgi:hypothetical protein
MKHNREIKKILKSVENKKGLLDIEKIKALSDNDKDIVVKGLLNTNYPIVEEFITENMKSVLISYGYFLKQKSNGYIFICNCQNIYRLKVSQDIDNINNNIKRAYNLYIKLNGIIKENISFDDFYKEFAKSK